MEVKSGFKLEEVELQAVESTILPEAEAQALVFLRKCHQKGNKLNQHILSSAQAYMAMFNFLEKYYEITKSNDVGALLGSMQLLKDGMPMDRGLVRHWDEAVHLLITSNN